MARLGRTLEEYESNGGWSYEYFSANAVRLMGELINSGIKVTIGRTVIHLSNDSKKLKTYVHHNGRTPEYATVTDARGAELLTVHYTEFSKLEEFLKGELCQ